MATKKSSDKKTKKKKADKPAKLASFKDLPLHIQMNVNAAGKKEKEKFMSNLKNQ